MRLLKTAIASKGKLDTVEFYGSDIPPYAILSHTWGDDEVLYADLKSPEVVAEKTGYDKIRLTLLQAAKDGLGYAWVDTCCINQESSAELSEAINTMYSWYGTANVCYAFLEDVPQKRAEPWQERFSKSRWFSRGWTLQELLAPRDVVFFNKHWTEMGTKDELAPLIESTTGIGVDFLHGRPLATASIARRMSWAARRTTTRPEDIAYCLLGIFDANMPMLYGEGSNAFIRLQEEIMRSTDDQTLFAWEDLTLPTRASTHRGLLAASPLSFAYSGNLVPFANPSSTLGYGPLHSSSTMSIQNHATHVMTNRGLRIDLNVRSRESTSSHTETPRDGGMLATLDCVEEGKLQHIAIALAPTYESAYHFARVQVDKLFHLEQPATTKRSLYVRQSTLGPKRAAPPFHLLRYRGFRNLVCGADHTRNELQSAGLGYGAGSHGLFVDATGTQGPWVQKAGEPPKPIAIPKGGNLLSACVLVHPTSGHSSKSDFFLLIGSDSSWRLSFGVVKRQENSRVDQENLWLVAQKAAQEDACSSMPGRLQRAFEPQPPGTPMELDGFAVVVVSELGSCFAPSNTHAWDQVQDIWLRIMPKGDIEKAEALKAAPRPQAASRSASGLLGRLRGGS